MWCIVIYPNGLDELNQVCLRLELCALPKDTDRIKFDGEMVIEGLNQDNVTRKLNDSFGIEDFYWDLEYLFENKLLKDVDSLAISFRINKGTKEQDDMNIVNQKYAIQ